MWKILVGGVFFLSAVSTFAGELNVVGTYSSFEDHEQSGDIVGMEIHIVPDPTGYSAVVQAAEGAPGYPVVVRANIDGSSVRFEIPTGSNCGLAPGVFIGTITAESLALNGPGLPANTRLKRGESYWQ